jgi:rod shape-determining protein MreD
MTKLVLSNIFRFVVLIVLQILLLNYVSFGGYMIPFIYILAVLMLPTRLGNIPLLLIAFAAGALIDIFCNIPGFHTFSCTMMAFIRVIIGNRMLTRDDPEAVIDVPSVYTVPLQPFAMYLLVMSVVYSFTYCMLESFSFGNFWMTMLSMLLDAVGTWLLLMLSQLLISPQKK